MMPLLWASFSERSSWRITWITWMIGGVSSRSAQAVIGFCDALMTAPLGEDALAAAMRDHGGFEHNRQALRIVEVIERKYPDFPGLNLTAEVRHSLLKHSKEQLCLEAQVVDASDRIAYNTHDIDDGLTSGLLQEEALDQVELWRKAAAAPIRLVGTSRTRNERPKRIRP